MMELVPSSLATADPHVSRAARDNAAASCLASGLNGRVRALPLCDLDGWWRFATFVHGSTVSEL